MRGKLIINKLIFILLFIGNIAFAQTTISTGYGSTKDKALKSAFQNAVEQEVGVLLDTKTVLKNGKLITNNILSFSNGFIKDYKELSAKQQMGLWKVKIEATVEHQQLLSKLKKNHINPKKVKNTNILYAQVVSEVKTKFDAENLLKKFYRTFTSVPIESYYIDVAKFDIDADLATKKIVPAKVELNIVLKTAPVVKQQLEEAHKLLSKICIKKRKTTTRIAYYFNTWLSGDTSYNNTIIVNNVNTEGSVSYDFPRSYSVIYPFNQENGFGKAKRKRIGYIKLILLDKNNKILKSWNFKNNKITVYSMVSGLKVEDDRNELSDKCLDSKSIKIPIKYLKRISQIKAKIVWK